MARIPRPNLIQDIFEAGTVDLENRPYLGYSEIGGPCYRQLYYKWRWAYKGSVDRRVMRIFTRGDIEEPRIQAEYKRVGLSYHSDQREVVGLAGHIKGHIDGLVDGLPEEVLDDPDETVLAEVKTMNNKRFATYKQKGLEKSDPKYWYQINAYMGRLELTKCLFIVHNKDTEERSYQIIEFSQEAFNEIKEREEQIIFAPALPNKIGEMTWFECKFCDAKNICHKGAEIERNCRTCEHVIAEDEGEWSCGLYKKGLTVEEQRDGCGHWNLDSFF